MVQDFANKIMHDGTHTHTHIHTGGGECREVHLKQGIGFLLLLIAVIHNFSCYLNCLKVVNCSF